MAKVGFIGLGVMGRPMAGHLIDAGHELSLFSRSGRPAELASRGKPCKSAKEVAENADVVITHGAGHAGRRGRSVRQGRSCGGPQARQDRHRHELDFAGRDQGLRQAHRRSWLRLSRRPGVRRRGRRQAGDALHHVRRLFGDLRQGQAALGKARQEHHPRRRERRGSDLQGRQSDRRRADDRGGRRGPAFSRPAPAPIRQRCAKP